MFFSTEGEAYHVSEELSEFETAFVDVCKMGLAGDSAGVRLAARRVVRRPPAETPHQAELREAVGAALASATITKSSLLRRAVVDEVPFDVETSFSLAALESPNENRPVLPGTAATVIDDIVLERQRGAELTAAGLTPTRTLLLTGPPGVGKTMTARYLATELGVPLLTIDLASVMSSYLGRTGQNLRSALRYGREHECVVFVDEFDALAKRRDDDSDIGELKRLVNVLLLELERWPADNLFVAATNHAELLDRAVARRFDAIVELPLPTPDARASLVRTLLDRFDRDIDDKSVQAIAHLMEGMSGSDVNRAMTSAVRRSVLDDRPVLEPLLEALAGGSVRPDRQLRDRLCRLAADELGWSQRRIADVLSISHPTVGSALRRTAADRG